MKKIAIMTMCVAAGFAASAQVTVVKEAERAMKGGQEFSKVVEIITPAFDNAETAKMAQTWFIPGKAAFADYDNMLGLKSFNKLPEGGEVKMAKLLVDGYDYFTKALPLDSVADAKGKIKTKYSKEIYNTLAGHFYDYSSAGVDFFNAKDYEGAYRAWGAFADIAELPGIQKNIPSVPADSVFGEILYNQALAAWQMNDFDKALKAFGRAKAKGYNKKQLYDYAIAVATGGQNEEAILAYAQEALPLYGSEDPMYMGQIINYYLTHKELDKAFDIIEKAIADEPENSQYYVIEGILYDQNEKIDEATASFKKAVELGPDNDSAVYNFGRILCLKAYKLNDEAPTAPAEYEKYYTEKIRPVFLEAAQYLEKAYELNNDNMDALKYLENVYYNLHDEANLEATRAKM